MTDLELELAAVRAALPPLGAPGVRIDVLAFTAQIDGERCLRRVACLCAAGEAKAERSGSGPLYVRRAEPTARQEAAEAPRSRYAPPEWVPTPDPGRGEEAE